MRRLLVRPQARLDLIEIWNHLADENVDVANYVAKKLDDAIRGLVAVPGKGHFRQDVSDKQYKFWTVFSYVIAYRYDDETVTIVHVVHGRRDFRRIFPEES